MIVVCGVCSCPLPGPAHIGRDIPLVLFTALGYFSLQPWVHPRFPDHHVSRFVDTGPWRIVGVVDARPLEFESRTQFVLRVGATSKANRKPTSVSGLAAGHGDRRDGRNASRETASRSAAASGPSAISTTPAGSISSAAWPTVRSGPAPSPTGTDLSLLEKRAESGWLGAGRPDSRPPLSRRIDQAGLGPEAAVLKALGGGRSIGDLAGYSARSSRARARATSWPSRACTSRWSPRSLSRVFRWLLSWIPPAIRHAWVRKGAAVLTLVPVTLYALIAGFSPSTQRALLMVSVFLLAFLVERETDLMNTLALAALVHSGASSRRRFFRFRFSSRLQPSCPSSMGLTV